MQPTTELARYSAAKKALADCVRVDEAKTIRDKAKGLLTYAMQAKDTELAGNCTDIMWRAQRRWGQLYSPPEMKATGVRGQVDGPGRGRKGKTAVVREDRRFNGDDIPTLRDMHVTKNQSVLWQAQGELTEAEFERTVEQEKQKVFRALRALEQSMAMKQSRAARQRSRDALPIPESYDYRIGDCREVLTDIADNSVAMILTDPPYEEASEPLYEWLAWFAARALIPGGDLICYTGHYRLRREMEIFDKHLRFWWPLIMLHDQQKSLPGKFVTVGYKPVLWYVKEKRRKKTLVIDVLRPKGTRDKIEHSWCQGEAGVTFLIENLTDPEDVIVDPFAGTGEWGRIACNEGRKWIGADIRKGGSAKVVA